MNRTPYRFWTVLLAVWWASGCSSLLLPSKEPPVYYRLDYVPKPVVCEREYPKALKVETFTASSPFDQRSMVVLDPGQRVRPSGNYQWVSEPGTLIAEKLLRDLSQGGLFASVVGQEDPKITPLLLTGHIFSFAWKKSDADARAVLKIKVSLRENTQSNRTLFSREYAIRSKPFGRTDDPAVFASAMNAVVSEFSIRLRRQLCVNAE